MHTSKVEFLRSEYTAILSQIDPATSPAWGKMNLQQMIEHMTDSFREANGKTPRTCINPPETVAKMQAFVMSDKPFRENTPNSLMPETPLPERNEGLADAIMELQGEIEDFFSVFGSDADKIITNPFFGDLNFELWVALLYKHAQHHLKQFGVVLA